MVQAQRFCGDPTPHSVHEWFETEQDTFLCAGPHSPKPVEATRPPVVEEPLSLFDQIKSLQERADLANDLERLVDRQRAEIRRLEEQVEHHRKRHGEVEQQLQALTTSPETKADTEAAFQRGVEHARSMGEGSDFAALDREIGRALLPALQHCGRLEEHVKTANAALTTAYNRIDEILNPKPAEPCNHERRVVSDFGDVTCSSCGADVSGLEDGGT